jgi:hypothetical protein
MVWNHIIKKLTFLFIICFLAPLAQASNITISRTAFSNAIERHEPTNKLNTIQHANQKIYFFTEVKNAHGKKITHQWSHNGWVTQNVTLSIKSNKWRTYSSKSFHPGTPKGTWTARVFDENGNVLTENTIDYLGKAALKKQASSVKASKTLADKIERQPAKQKKVKKNEPQKNSPPKTVKAKAVQKTTKRPEKTAKTTPQTSSKQNKLTKEASKITEKTQKAAAIKQKTEKQASTKNSSVKTAMAESINNDEEEDCDAEDDTSADDQIVSGLEKNLIK